VTKYYCHLTSPLSHPHPFPTRRSSDLTVEAFVHAAIKGYEYAIDNPDEAAEILIDSEPDVDAELIKQSQKWLSEKYQDDADQFGIQEKERWEMTKDFMLEH